MGDFMELNKYNSRYVLSTVESPNFIRSSQAMHIAQCFGILKKLTFLQDELFVHFFTMQNLVILILTFY